MFCDSVKLTKTLCAWFAGVEDLALEEMPAKQFLFGAPRGVAKAATINFILMNVKFFIFRQRLFHGGRLELLHWLREFKSKLMVEKQICNNEGKTNRFRKWVRIFNAIG